MIAALISWTVLLGAPTAFPRGPGFYFSLIKLAVTLLVFLCWVATCSWVNRDTREVDMPTLIWNPIVWGSGLAGLLVVWALPWFWISLVVLLTLYLTSSLIYVTKRNELVSEDQKVLTERHLKEVAHRYLKLKFEKGEEEEKPAPTLRFLGKSSKDSADDTKRLARVESSKGYRSAVVMVAEAIQRRATDIHMEPTREEMTVRYRIDGILNPAEPYSRAMGDAAINIFKVLCDMDITEKRKPQDGSFSAEMDGRPIDFRVATAGSVVGEKLVMRILDKSRNVVTLSQLGMRDKMREHIHTLVSQPHGMVIVCGPTGAGKSTTLYACLNEIDRYQRNVITIENPVEMQISNVTQIEVNPKAGKTFASELRSILRQDPDVILIGEIRDQETAEIACQAAQTGHMVFTTLHANDSVSALARLIDLGVQPFSVASAVSAILSQRLVRLLCPECKIRYKPNPEVLRKANLPMDRIKYFYKPPGPSEDGEQGQDEAGKCPHCGGSGYHGRIGIFELLLVTDPIRDLVRENPNPNIIKQEAVKHGMKSLQEDALRQVIEGKTSIQEVLRVCK